MRKAIYLILILLLSGCATSRKGVQSFGSETLDVESVGVGSSEDSALKEAFRKAVLDATGSFIYSSQALENRKIIEDMVGSYSQGFIKDYKVISKAEKDGITVLTVKSTVEMLPIRNILAKSEGRSQEDVNAVIRKLSQIDDAQERIIQAKQVMDAFVGDGKDFFQRAYDVDMVGYEVREITSTSVKGDYLVRVKLKQTFWDNYRNLLSVIKVKSEDNRPGLPVRIVKTVALLPVAVIVEGVTMPEDWHQKLQEFFRLKSKPEPEKTLIKSKSAGMAASGCPPVYQTKFMIPEEVERLPIVGLKFKRPDWAAMPQGTEQEVYLNHNVYTYLPTESAQRRPELIPPDRMIYRAGLFDGISVCENTQMPGAHPEQTFIIFKDSLTVKIPFSEANTKNIKDTVLRNEIPWSHAVYRNPNP